MVSVAPPALGVTMIAWAAVAAQNTLFASSTRPLALPVERAKSRTGPAKQGVASQPPPVSPPAPSELSPRSRPRSSRLEHDTRTSDATPPQTRSPNFIGLLRLRKNPAHVVCVGAAAVFRQEALRE